jgi:hypothetical protein
MSQENEEVLTPEFSEKFLFEDDKVKYVRTYPKIPTGTVKVEVYLTHAYLSDAPKESIQKYLNNACAAILTRNGVQDA